jgi:hypothetical protein
VCGAIATSTARCQAGHFVCDACHSADALDLIEHFCARSDSCDPIELCTELMRSPAIHMHGPEHHFLVPAALLATYDNLRGKPELKGPHLKDARERASRVPGGFCGTHGNCGAAVGTGIFWSVVTGSTPLSHESWCQCNALTGRSLMRISEAGGPRCCKRDSYLAVIEAMAHVNKLQSSNWSSSKPICEHSERNEKCSQGECLFHHESEVQLNPADPMSTMRP